jgi:hypothetical protein
LAISRPHSSGFGYQDRSRDVDARDDWRLKLERLKQGKYNKPHWLRYIRGGINHRALQKKKKKVQHRLPNDGPDGPIHVGAIMRYFNCTF